MQGGTGKVPHRAGPDKSSGMQGSFLAMILAYWGEVCHAGGLRIATVRYPGMAARPAMLPKAARSYGLIARLRKSQLS